MNPTFFKHFSSFLLQGWPWLKAGFYSCYFLFIQLSNNVESSFMRFLVNTFFFIVAIGIIEIGLYFLHQIFRRRCYKRAVLTFAGSYMVLAVVGYYILHENRNFIATEIWDRQFKASWGVYLLSFNQFYWTFFKYAVILFLIRQVLLLVRLLHVREGMHRTASSNTNNLGVHPSYQPIAAADIHVANAGFPPLAHAEPLREGLDSYRTLKFKAGTVTYMLDVATIVYLEVRDELTTIYRIDGSCLEVKIPLSKFCTWLPKERFARIHESRVVALPYIFREVKGHIYMVSYEDKPLKLGNQEKYPLYKRWKTLNLLK